MERQLCPSGQPKIAMRVCSVNLVEVECGVGEVECGVGAVELQDRSGLVETSQAR